MENDLICYVIMFLVEADIVTVIDLMEEPILCQSKEHD
jgi:hypothetical protein